MNKNTFGDAIAALKEGKRATRKNWRGEGTIALVVLSSSFSQTIKENPEINQTFDDTDEIYNFLSLSEFTMVGNKTNKENKKSEFFKHWFPTDEDISAEDWVIFD